MSKATLVVMAAGIGSRFGGGIKQLEPVGPNGELIIDYSIYDAMEAGFDKVVFVIRKDLERNVLVVAHGDESGLYSRALETGPINWIPSRPEKKQFECRAKFRYRQDEQNVLVTQREGGVYVEFEQKQRAITEGQYAVFYDETRCLGGGVIEKAFF